VSAAPSALVTPIGATEIDAAREYFVGLHTQLTDAWKSLDAASEQRRDEWQRPAGDVLSGSGRLSLIENGATFDRAGVAFSDVSGARLPAAASERHTELAGQPFRAMGTSCVVHPVNPYAPTSHANVRLFTARGGEVWWFGGGFDLTPVYPFADDARTWHEAARAACAPAGPRAYALLKDACDKYFYLPHRGETRGIGGLFADDLNDTTAEIGGNFEQCFALIRRIGDAYLDTYANTLWGAGTGLPAPAPRALRGIQPGLRSRHAFRAAVPGAHRIAAHVDAATRGVAVRLSPGARLAGSSAR